MHWEHQQCVRLWPLNFYAAELTAIFPLTDVVRKTENKSVVIVERRSLRIISEPNSQRPHLFAKCDDDVLNSIRLNGLLNFLPSFVLRRLPQVPESDLR